MNSGPFKKSANFSATMTRTYDPKYKDEDDIAEDEDDKFIDSSSEDDSVSSFQGCLNFSILTTQFKY